jgi:hypothetical protein
MNEVKPIEVIGKVVGAIPPECRENIVIIGSLAAAYAYFGHNHKIAVRTKDIDCLIKPFAVAADKARIISRQLIDAGWKRRIIGPHQNPGTPDTSTDELPAIRLYPPDHDPKEGNDWFVELLTEPETSADQGKKWTRVVIDEGHFGLPSFRFLSVTAYHPQKIDGFGIFCARPDMMALANLLEHPEIKPELMSTLIEGRSIKRSNKDLGRVIALGYLEMEKKHTDIREWGKRWAEALLICFPDEWKILAHKAGNGLTALLQSDEDLEEALHTCTYGLLNNTGIQMGEFKEVGQRMLGDSVGTLRHVAESAAR